MQSAADMVARAAVLAGAAAANLLAANAELAAKPETSTMRAPVEAHSRIPRRKRSFVNFCTHLPWCVLAVELSHAWVRPLTLRPRFAPGLPLQCRVRFHTDVRQRSPRA